jgi:predicted O-methyltransferase YrrM
MPMPPHLKVNRVVSICRILEAEMFVETGTYRGDTSAAASRFVDEVITVEIDVRLAELARRRFAQGNVSVLTGDSGDLMAEIVRRSEGKSVLYWLDGHFSAGVTGGNESLPPLKRELDDIMPSLQPGSLVLIDDVREFGSNGYPTVNDMNDIAVALNYRSTSAVLDDMLLIGHAVTIEMVQRLLSN